MTTRGEWLAGAEQRRQEPARPDDPDAIRARLATVAYRPGGSWATHAIDHPDALVTLVQYDPAEEPDGQGRRPSDRLVGVLVGADLARRAAQLLSSADTQGSAGP